MTSDDSGDRVAGSLAPPDPAAIPEYLTTRELAALLRIKERKVYDLAASGDLPCVRVMGKLLFPEREVRAWLARGREPGAGGEQAQGRPHGGRRLPNVLLGSHDPLLERSLRESRCGLATFLDGSLDGLERFAAGEGVACGLHVRDASSGTWNLSAVTSRKRLGDAVLVRFATRRRGLVTAPDAAIDTLADLPGRRLVARQPGSGAQTLLDQLLGEAGIEPSDAASAGVARSESDAVSTVARGEADVAFGLESVAAEHRLRFVPLVDERFDLLVDRRAWFEPSWQGLLAYWRSAAFARLAAGLPGHDVAGLGDVLRNP